MIENKEQLPWTTLVGAAGMPGATAWIGLYDIGKPKKGETIFGAYLCRLPHAAILTGSAKLARAVSAASGAVGQIVGQLAKRDGLFTIGSAGTDEKVAFLKEIGYDVAFNCAFWRRTFASGWRSLRCRAPLTQLIPSRRQDRVHAEDLGTTPSGHFLVCPICFRVLYSYQWVDDEDHRDNVGGETLDIVYNTIKQKGRIIACGAISQYNLPEEKKYGVKNTAAIVTKSLRHEGFIVSQFPQDEFNEKMPPLVKSGEIK